MNEFLNVLEVDKLPLNKMDRFIGVDVDGSIKSASVIVDSELNEDSINAIANNTVTKSLRAFKEDVDSTVEYLIQDVDTNLNALSTKVESDISGLTNTVQSNINTLSSKVDKSVQDITDFVNAQNDKLRYDVTEDLEDMQSSVDSAIEYLEETVGNIDSVLLQILG
jgi:uncharacterized protein YicC (UPF0701 family)